MFKDYVNEYAHHIRTKWHAKELRDYTVDYKYNDFNELLSATFRVYPTRVCVSDETADIEVTFRRIGV